MLVSPFISHPIHNTIYLRINYNLLPDNASVDFKIYALSRFLSALKKQEIGLESYVIHNRLSNYFNSKEEISEDIILNFSEKKNISLSEINDYLVCFYDNYLLFVDKRYEISLHELYGDDEIINPIHLKNWLSLIIMYKNLNKILPNMHEDIMREKI